MPSLFLPWQSRDRLRARAASVRQLAPWISILEHRAILERYAAELERQAEAVDAAASREGPPPT